MQTVLFHSTIFGPIHSRRLGSSLGINLLPDDGKICSFDCLYCEAGYNAQGTGSTGLPSRGQVAKDLEAKLAEMRSAGAPLDVITFSGNGEPTLHPDFDGVVDDTIALRDKYYPDVKISVLTNATRIGNPSVAAALRKIDNNIMKLDSAVAATVNVIDRPNPGYDLDKTIELLASFGRQGIIQTMMCRGEHEGGVIDNTSDVEIEALIEAYRRIAPREIMLYTIDRPTPEVNLRRVSKEELTAIAERITAATGIFVQVSA